MSEGVNLEPMRARTTVRLDEHLLKDVKRYALEKNKTLTAAIEEALSFADNLIDHPNCTVIAPTAKHWATFTLLCREINVRGNDVTDAYLAALATEHNCEFVTTDKGFKRFSGLRWRHPLD